MLGPGGTDSVWDAVIRKADDTILRWSQLGLGFSFNVLACNIYVLSLFNTLISLQHAMTKSLACSSEWNLGSFVVLETGSLLFP